MQLGNGKLLFKMPAIVSWICTPKVNPNLLMAAQIHMGVIAMNEYEDALPRCRRAVFFPSSTEYHLCVVF